MESLSQKMRRAMAWIFLLVLFMLPTVRGKAHPKSHAVCMKTMFHLVRNQLWRKSNVSTIQIEERQFVKFISKRMNNESKSETDDYDEEANKKKSQLIYSLANHICVETICQLGCDGGFTVLNWLAAAPKSHVLAFDFSEQLDDYNFEKEYIASATHLHPERYYLYQGPMISSIPGYMSTNQTAKCNIISIGKNENTWMYLEAFRQFADPFFNLVLIENCCIGDIACDLDIIEESALQAGAIILKYLFEAGLEPICLLTYSRQSLKSIELI